MKIRNVIKDVSTNCMFYSEPLMGNETETYNRQKVKVVCNMLYLNEDAIQLLWIIVVITEIESEIENLKDETIPEWHENKLESTQ